MGADGLSGPVRPRSQAGAFGRLQALRGRTLIAFDGGGLRSTELKRTSFRLATMQVLHGVRKYYAQTRTPPPVVLVLGEAGAPDLVTPSVLTALQELRKAGPAVRLITQSMRDVGDQGVFEAVLANTPWQAWCFGLPPADQGLGARALANPTADPLAVHLTRTCFVPNGTESATSEGRGLSTGRGGPRRNRQTGRSFGTRYRVVVGEHDKTPRLREREGRTKLATLSVGERLVRDLAGVQLERVIPAGFTRGADRGKTGRRPRGRFGSRGRHPWTRSPGGGRESGFDPVNRDCSGRKNGRPAAPESARRRNSGQPSCRCLVWRYFSTAGRIRPVAT